MRSSGEGEGLAELSGRLGVGFSDPGLLALAMVHPSALNEGASAPPESNQRLEFLGDAVVGLAVAAELYRLHPDWDEGRLTLARSELVSGRTLAEAAAELGLGEFLVLGRGEEAQGGRARQSNLAAALEAVVGARLLDAGHGPAAALALALLGDRVADAAGEALPSAPTALQELLHARGSPSPVYLASEPSGEPHAPVYTVSVEVDGAVIGRGSGPSKASARREAARAALGRLS